MSHYDPYVVGRMLQHLREYKSILVDRFFAKLEKPKNFWFFGGEGGPRFEIEKSTPLHFLLLFFCIYHVKLSSLALQIKKILIMFARPAVQSPTARNTKERRSRPMKALRAGVHRGPSPGPRCAAQHPDAHRDIGGRRIVKKKGKSIRRKRGREINPNPHAIFQ